MKHSLSIAPASSVGLSMHCQILSVVCSFRTRRVLKAAIAVMRRYTSTLRMKISLFSDSSVPRTSHLLSSLRSRFPKP